MSGRWYTVLRMHLTGTEMVYDDLWSTAVFSRLQSQYVVTYRTDVADALVENVWKHVPMDELLITDQYYDKDLGREVVILERDHSGKT